MAVAETSIEEETRPPAIREQPAAALVPDWSQIKEQASVLEAAGKGTQILPKGIQNRYQVAAILLKGAELGFPAMYSLEQIALVDGKPVIQGQALAALIIRAEGEKAIKWIATTDDKCTVGLKRRTDKEYETLTWTIEDAKRANLTNKNNWKNYPRTMLRWRALAEAARMFMPDVIAGVFTPDELGIGVAVTDEGDSFIEGEFTRTEVPHDAFNGNGQTEPAPKPAAETKPDADTRKPGQAEWNTLEGVVRELLTLQGKSPDGWKSAATSAIHRGMGLKKSVDHLTMGEFKQLIEIASTQRDFLAAEKSDEAAPEAETATEQEELPTEESF